MLICSLVASVSFSLLGQGHFFVIFIFLFVIESRGAGVLNWNSLQTGRQIVFSI